MLLIARRTHVQIPVLKRALCKASYEGSIPQGAYKRVIQDTKKLNTKNLMDTINEDPDLTDKLDSIEHTNKKHTHFCIQKNLETVCLPSSGKINASTDNIKDLIDQAIDLTFPYRFGTTKPKNKK